MTIEAELPDGTIVEFPDGTSRDVMKAAMGRHVQKQRDAITAKPVQTPIPMQGEEGSPAGDFIRNKDGTKFRNATNFSTDLQNFGAGAGRGFDKLLDGITDLYAKATGDTKVREGLATNVAEKRRLDVPLAATSAGAGGELATDVALTAVPGYRGAKIASMLPRARLAAGLGAAGTTNAAYDATKIPDPGETREGNAAVGFGTGVVGEGTGRVLGRTIEGIVKKSRAASRLPQSVQDAATLGQLADRKTLSGRLASGTEEKLTSIPVVGDAITNARRGGVDAWRDNVLESVVPPGGSVPKGVPSRDQIEAIQDQFATEYKKALPAGLPIKPSSAFESRVIKDTSDPMAGLTNDQQDAVRQMVLNYYHGMFSGAPGQPAKSAISPQQAKDFEAFLSAKARSHRMANLPESGSNADLYGKIEDAWTSAYRSQLPLSTRKALKPLDQQYAPFKTAERAATSVGNEEGAFTPNQLLNSVKSRTTKPEFARGGGMLQDQADTGKSVFQNTVPNSGTFDRGANMGALAWAMSEPASFAASMAAGVPLMTSKVGKRTMMGETRAQMLLKKLRANEALRMSGAPIGQGYEDLME